MQTATSETESNSRDLSICVHHYTLRAPCPKGQGNRSLRGRRGRFGTLVATVGVRVFWEHSCVPMKSACVDVTGVCVANAGADTSLVGHQEERNLGKNGQVTTHDKKAVSLQSVWTL